MKQLDVIDVNQNKRMPQSGNARRTEKVEYELSEEERRRRIRQRRAKKLAMKRRKRQQRIRLISLTTILLVLVLTVTNWKSITTAVQNFGKAGSISAENDAAGDESASSSSTSKDTVQAWADTDNFLYEVEFEDFFKKYEPEALEESQVYRRLKDLAEEFPDLKPIYEKSDEYPVRMLASLCNNPEMHEFVKGYLQYDAGDTSVAQKPELTEEEKAQKYPLFLQWDARWGYESYGDFNIAMSGCGPTTLAMAAVAVTGDRTITPDKVAEYSMENGFYVEGTGTAWSLMTDGAKDFSLKAREISLDEAVMKQALDDGKVIICSMRPGDFTSVGHFVMIYDYDENGFKLNDPNCIYRSSRYWTYRELSSQIRILWSYEKT